MAITIDQMKQRKKELGYSYVIIAERSGLPLGTVQKVLGGITKAPRHDTLKALERALFPELQLSNDKNQAYGTNKKINSITPAADSADPSSGIRFASDRAPAGRSSGTHCRNLNPDDQYTQAGGMRQMMAQEAAGKYRTSSNPEIRFFGKRQGEYTLQDREALPEEIRTELIDGILYLMASPTTTHQIISGQIYYQLCSFIYSRGGSCTPFIAPSDVRLDRDDFTVVQPDVYIVCSHDEEDITQHDEEDSTQGEEKEKKSGKTGKEYADFDSPYTEGAPDFIAEVLSPSTKIRDMTIKAEKYRKAGVREYWIVDPVKERVITYIFGDDPDISISSFDNKIPVNIYGGECLVDFSQIRDRVKMYEVQKDRLRKRPT